MPRLLSNREPEKKTEPRILSKTNKQPEKKTEPRILSKTNKQPEVKIAKINPKKTEKEMSSWEYYSFLMRYGKRKMDRLEWLTWRMKRDEEESYKRYLNRKEMDGPPELKLSPAEFNWRAYHVGDVDERLIEIVHRDNRGSLD